MTLSFCPSAMSMSSTQSAVIIGASSGIGEALAHELHRAGGRSGLVARRVDRLETLGISSLAAVRGNAAASSCRGLVQETGVTDCPT